MAGRGLLSEILASEMAVFHYAFKRVREEQSPGSGGRSFTYHRNCDYLGLVLAISILVFFEMVAVHLLVHHYWDATPAWILTGLSGYGFLWLRADSVASTRRLVEAGPEGLVLRCGLRWTARIQWQQVAGIELLDAGSEIPRGCLRMVLAAEPNCLLRLKQPVSVTGMYGIRRSAGTVCVAIDDVIEFQRVIESNIRGNSTA